VQQDAAGSLRVSLNLLIIPQERGQRVENESCDSDGSG